MKHCSNKNCKQVNPQPLVNFYKKKTNSDGLQYECKECKKEKSNQYLKNNPGKNAEYHRKARKKNPEIYRSRQLLYDYGITLEQYSDILSEQNNCCKICETPAVEFSRNLCVDHNHVTNKIRGILCDDCNKAIGLLKDNPKFCDKAAEYLRISDGELRETSQISGQKEAEE